MSEDKKTEGDIAAKPTKPRKKRTVKSTTVKTKGGKPRTKTAGAPTKFKPEYVEQARILTAKGLIDLDLAEFFGVSESSIHEWKRVHPSFSQSIIDGKDEYNTSLVEASLRHRATGYSHEDIDIRVVNGKIVKTPITKHYPPDTAAIKFFLSNRDANRWKERQQVNHDVEPESPLASLLKSISGNAIGPKED